MAAIADRVTITNLSKTFPGTRALDGVSMAIKPGEVHGLVGGNGSGKSTLIKIVSGIYRGDAGGSIRFDDEVVPSEETTPNASYAAGVRVVHQDLGIFRTMTVAENLSLGSTFNTGPGGWIRRRATIRRTWELIDRFGIPARPGTQLAELSRTGQTLVAIARALQDQNVDHGGLLILDEPTAALPAHEVEVLLESLRRYATAGQSILYVSHRLDEILSFTDRVTVLRNGRLATTTSTADLDEHELIELIVGRRVDRMFPPRSNAGRGNSTVLEMDKVSVGPAREVSFEVRQGEIVGLAGLLGTGRSELLRSVFGDMKRESGSIRLDGEEISFGHPRNAMRAGVALVPEDRGHEAAFLDLPITTNSLLPALRRYWNGVWLNDRAMGRDAGKRMSEFLVKARSEGSLLDTLSGGNQQKVVLARWLGDEPRLLLLDEPTQGVDVGARAEIYKFVREAADRGMSVVVVASDLEELAHAVDRAIVLRGGRVVAEVSDDDLNAHNLTRLSYGMNGREVAPK